MTAPAGSAVTGPAPSAELLTPNQLAASDICTLGADWIRDCCNDGSLHAHRPRDLPKSRWSIPKASAMAWIAGLDDDEQRRVCPLCQATAPAPTPTAQLASRRGRRRRT